MDNINKSVNQEVWNSKDRALDAQSSIKSSTSFYAGSGKTKEVLELAEKFYNFIQSKRSSQVNDHDYDELNK